MHSTQANLPLICSKTFKSQVILRVESARASKRAQSRSRAHTTFNLHANILNWNTLHNNYFMAIAAGTLQLNGSTHGLQVYLSDRICCIHFVATKCMPFFCKNQTQTKHQHSKQAFCHSFVLGSHVNTKVKNAFIYVKRNLMYHVQWISRKLTSYQSHLNLSSSFLNILKSAFCSMQISFACAAEIQLKNGFNVSFM